MRSSSEASSTPSCRSKKPNLRSSKKTQSSDQIPLSTKTPELTRHTTRRTRNRGVALSVSDVRKVAESLQDRDKPETTPSRGKTARRQLDLHSSPRKPKKTSAADEPFELPEKYEILGKFFDSLVSSIRLLRLRGSKTSFSNISLQISYLTDRRFTHGNLAQLRFLLPEAIEIKKVLVFDERTSCMRPDLHVAINPDAVEYDAKSAPKCSNSMLLTKIFRARLIEFCKSHPEANEIPEGILPEPFNRPKQDQFSDILRRPSSSVAAVTLSGADAALPSTISSAAMPDNVTSANTEFSSGLDDSSVPVRTSIESPNQQLAVASLMPKSFERRFSWKPKENGADISQKKLPSDSFQPPVSQKEPISVGSGSNPNALPAKLPTELASSEVCPRILASSGAPPATPSKNIEFSENKDVPLKGIGAVSTPAKHVLTPAKLMSATPALPPPKRSFMTDDNSSSSPNKLARRPPRTRSLKFDTPVKNNETENEYEDGGLSIDNDLCDILPKDLMDSIREKERKAMEERNPAISEAKRRQKMISRLPKLFNMIHLLFQSINRSVITKEELVSKIITGHCDIVDRREVEEQLNLLLELAPEWISEKLASSGDFLFCINKMVDAKAIRTLLEEAK